MKPFTRRVLLSTVLLVSAVALMAQTDPFVGKWVRSSEKSKYNPGPGPQSQTVTLSPDGNVVIDGLDPQGKPYKWSYKKSEAAVPIEGVDGTVSSKVSGNTVDNVWKIAGKNTTGRGVISKNGKTMTYKQEERPLREEPNTM